MAEQFVDHLDNVHVGGIDDYRSGGYFQGSCTAAAVVSVSSFYAGQDLFVGGGLAALLKLLVAALGSGGGVSIKEKLDLGVGKNGCALIASLGDQGGQLCAQLPLTLDHFVADAPPRGNKVSILGYLYSPDRLGDIAARDGDFCAMGSGEQV